MLTLCAVLYITFHGFAQSWQRDPLLPGYEALRIEQPDDYHGQVIATLVRKLDKCRNDRAILYVHGYNDYFFQEHMGNEFVDSCWNFYALDLRKYGRSLQPGQQPYEVRNVDEYFADLDTAISIIRRQGIDNIILMGHSTGGLITARYMQSVHPAAVKGLILNSPFLDWNMGGFMRRVAIPMVSCLGKHFPDIRISQGDSDAYASSLLASKHGEWTFDTTLKTVHPGKGTAGWIRAISEAQNRLLKGPRILVPILLMHSDKSIHGSQWTPAHNTGDAVLDVDDIARRGCQLGPDVREVTIADGLHDLMLSSLPVRRRAFDSIFGWLDSLGFPN